MASLFLFRSLAGAIGVALFSSILIGAVAANAPTGSAKELPSDHSFSSLIDEYSLLSAASSIALREVLKSAFSRIFLVGAVIIGECILCIILPAGALFTFREGFGLTSKKFAPSPTGARPCSKGLLIRIRQFDGRRALAFRRLWAQPPHSHA